MTRLFAGTPFDRPSRCERCGALEADCQCPPPPIEYLSPERQKPRLALERRKGGRVVTIIRGLKPDESNLPELLTKLKASCGAGGTIEPSEKDPAELLLVVQGDHLTRISHTLQAMGYGVKTSGK